MANIQGNPIQSYNGGVVTQEKVTPFINKTHTDVHSLLNFYGGDQQRMWLGMIKRWHQWNILSTPLINMTDLAGNTKEIDFPGQFMAWATPYKLGWPVLKEVLVDATVQKLGVENTVIPVLLSAQFAQGTIITDQLRDGLQLRVKEGVEYQVSGNGETWKHYLVLNTEDPTEYVTRDELYVGSRWTALFHASGEHSNDAAVLNPRSGTGVLYLERPTSNSEIHIKHWVTAQADRIGPSTEYHNPTMGNVGFQGFDDKYRSSLHAVTNFYQPENTFTDPKTGKKIVPFKWVPRIIDLMSRELALMKEYSLMWSKGGEFRDPAGKIVKLPVGYYHWIKEYGTYRQYYKPSQIGQVLNDVMLELFAGRNDIQHSDRVIRWRGGMGALLEIQKYFQTQFFVDNPFMIINDGRNPFLQGMISGKYDSMKIRQPKIISYQFPMLGTVEIEWDSTLDFIDGDNRSRSYVGSLPESSYMVFIEDVTDQKFSNAIPKGGNVERMNALDTDNGPNVIQLRPRGFVESINFLPGIGGSPTLDAFAGISQKIRQVASTDRGFGIYMDTCGEIFVKDATRVALIELVPDTVHSY